MNSFYATLKCPYAPYYALAGLFLLHIFLAWPGMMTPDSEDQYSMALTGAYNDHHPPMTSFVWRYLDEIHPGPGLIMTLHLSFLYAAMGVFMSAFKDIRIKFFYVLPPLIPPILVYSWMIWKDVGFAFSYLLLAAILTRSTLLRKKLSLLDAVAIFLLLFYGTAVKFQAQYCAPAALLWIAYIYNNHKFNWATSASVFIVGALFFTALNAFNSALVPDTGKSHSWQLVKLYDLAAISSETDQPLFPEFAKRPDFDMETLRRLANSQRVDDLTFGDDPLLKMGKTEEQRRELWNYWLKTVVKHPFIYARHRFKNSLYTLLSVPVGYIPRLNDPWKAIMSHPGSPLLKVAVRILGTLLFAPLPIVILSFLYMSLALKTLFYEKAAVPLLFMNLIGLTMVVILFFFSMAGTPRYTYISVCLTHASHTLAFLCGQALLRNRRLAKVDSSDFKNSVRRLSGKPGERT